MVMDIDSTTSGTAAGSDGDDHPSASGEPQQQQPSSPAHSHDTGAEPVVLVEASSASDGAAAVVSEWLPCVNEHGEAYFCNVGTGETRWDLPARLESADREAETERVRVTAADASACGEEREAVATPPLDAHVQRKSLLLVQQVMGGAVKRVDRNVQLQLEEARRRHRELEELRDEQVRLGGEHWVEMYDPAHDSFYYYGAFSGDMRWDRPDSYVLKVGSDTVLRLVVQLQCAFRMALARRRVFRAKKARAEQQRRQSVAAAADLALLCAEVEGGGGDAAAAADESQEGDDDDAGDDEADEDDEEEAAEAADTVPDGEQCGILHRGSSRWLSSIPELHQEHESDDVWVEVYDPLHKLVYYHCAATGETRWDPPRIFISAAEDKEMAAAIAIQSLSRSFLARRGVKQRKLSLRRRRQEQAVLEARQLRERRHREFLSKSEDERASMCRREMLEEEMAQIRRGDRFWGVDAHDREVRRQEAEEQLLATSETFWQRVNASLKTRSELFAQRTKALERQRREDESAGEADALDAMAAAEAQQRELGDSFWGIQGEEQREERARRDMLDEEVWSRSFGRDAHARELRAAWKADAEGSAERSARDKVVFEKRHQQKYMKWFYRDCTSVDELLDYVWPTTWRLALQPPATPAKSGLSSPNLRGGASSYILDDLVVKQRLASGDLRYGNKSIFTIHHANSAQILGRKGGFAIDKVGDTRSAFESAMAKYKPPPASPAKPAPPRRDVAPEDEERLRLGTAVHYKRSKTPDPHVPARFNGVPFKPSQISPTRDILCGSHTKLTQLPSLAAKSKARSPTMRSASPTHAESLAKSNKTTLARNTRTTRSNNDGGSSPRTSSFLQRHLALFQHDTVDLKPPASGAADLYASRQHHPPEHEDGEVSESFRFESDRDERCKEGESDGGEAECHRLPRQTLLEQFALNELDALRRVFALMDYDGSGAVDQKEMAWALQRDEEIAEVASQSALLRVFVKHPAQLDELFLRLGPPELSSRAGAAGEDSASSTNRQQQTQELSWDVFLDFCRHKYVDLMNDGVLKPPHGLQPHGASSSQNASSSRAAASPYHEEEEERKIRELFAILDCDANGVLEVEELQNALADAANDREIGQLVGSCKALQPLLRQATFMDAFREFEPEDPRGISEEEFVAFCLEIASIAQFNGLL